MKGLFIMRKWQQNSLQEEKGFIIRDILHQLIPQFMKEDDKLEILID